MSDRGQPFLHKFQVSFAGNDFGEQDTHFWNAVTLRQEPLRVAMPLVRAMIAVQLSMPAKEIQSTIPLSLPVFSGVSSKQN
jgi:hypothetical protein